MKKMILSLALIFICGCASLNNREENDLEKWDQQGVTINDKDPTTGAFLGLLPGVGSFYTGQIGLGVVDLLLWPLSVCWDTSAGYQGAKVRNWEKTSVYVEELERKRKVALDKLEDMHDRHEVSDMDFRKIKREINDSGLKAFEKEFDLEARIVDRQTASTPQTK